MTPVISDPVELRRRGFSALVETLGWVNAVRFIQQYEKGQGDYSRERERLLPAWDAETLVDRALDQNAAGQVRVTGGQQPPALNALAALNTAR